MTGNEFPRCKTASVRGAVYHVAWQSLTGGCGRV